MNVLADSKTVHNQDMSTSIDVLKEKARRMRIASVRATTEAGSGHPTSCMSAADLVAGMFFNEMRYDPKDPHNPANDRFVLSKGHAAPLLYAAFAEAGFLPRDSVMSLRRIDSDLEGHPTPRFPWTDVATGSLGQGLSAAVGAALASRLDGLGFDVYTLLGDGECAEGSVWEAAEIASHYGLENLFAVVDVNGLGQSQRTMYEFDVDVYAERFRAFGWYALTIDGHDFEQILDAFRRCREEGGKRPRAIVAKTYKGKGISALENKDGWHGKPVPKADLEAFLKELETPVAADAVVPARTRPRPEARPVSNLGLVTTRKLGDLAATREAYGDALAKLVQVDSRIVVLDGDTKNSTFSERALKVRPDQFLEMFIAEQNMVGVAMGLAARGKIPFASTFAAFLTRAYDQIRMAAVSQSNLKLCGSHCGVSIGEDGPSQMGLEDIAMFRPIPGAVVLYPSDAVSAEKLVLAAAQNTGMFYIRTTRPKTPVLYSNDEEFPIGGAKILRQSTEDRATVIGAGITLHEALKAATALEADGVRIRVIDAYSVKPIDRKTIVQSVAATGGRVVVVEDHYEHGGLGDAVLDALEGSAVVRKLAVREIPRSGMPDELLDHYGISAKHIANAVHQMVR